MLEEEEEWGLADSVLCHCLHPGAAQQPVHSGISGYRSSNIARSLLLNFELCLCMYIYILLLNIIKKKTSLLLLTSLSTSPEQMIEVRNSDQIFS